MPLPPRHHAVNDEQQRRRLPLVGHSRRHTSSDPLTPPFGPPPPPLPLTGCFNAGTAGQISRKVMYVPHGAPREEKEEAPI